MFRVIHSGTTKIPLCGATMIPAVGNFDTVLYMIGMTSHDMHFTIHRAYLPPREKVHVRPSRRVPPTVKSPFRLERLARQNFVAKASERTITGAHRHV